MTGDARQVDENSAADAVALLTRVLETSTEMARRLDGSVSGARKACRKAAERFKIALQGVAS